MSIISGIRGGLTSSEVIALIGRNKPDGTAGIYTCKTILNEHRPVCTKEYHLVGNQLDAQYNPDVWHHINGAGDGSTSYSNRFLTLTSGTGTTSATRCVIDQTRFPISGNFIEVTCRIGAIASGAGGTRYISLGFQPAFNAMAGTNSDRAVFYYRWTATSKWNIGTKGEDIALNTLPIGRELQTGDVVTVRLDRQEGSANIDIARFYVNGQKVYETLNIPTVDCYAGIGVFTNEYTTTPMSISIDYFGVKFVP
jgi:hypothetical protein